MDVTQFLFPCVVSEYLDVLLEFENLLLYVEYGIAVCIGNINLW